MTIEEMSGGGASSPLFWIVLIVIGGILLAKLYDKWFRK